MDSKKLEPIKNLIRKPAKFSFIIRLYLLLGIFWSVVASLLILASEGLLFLPSPWPGFIDYGHLKPVSSLILLFGAFLSFLLGLGYSILEKDLDKLGSKLKLPMALLALFCLKLHQLGLLLGIISIFLGFNKGRMLGEMPWLVDSIFIFSLLCLPLLLVIGFLKQGLRLRESPHLLLFLSFACASFYYLLGNFGFPTGPFSSTPLVTGIQDMTLEALYLSGLLYFLIVAGLLGLLYYYVPFYYKTTLYSSSIPSFLSLSFLFLVPLGGLIGLLHTAAPVYLQSLGIFCTMALNFAVIAGGLNAKYSITRSDKKYRSDALGLMLRAGIFFFLLTALARVLLAPSFMQAWLISEHGTFAPRDPIFNIQAYGLLLLFPLAIIVLQKSAGRAYPKKLLAYLAFFWILGAFLFYTGAVGASLSEHAKASALDLEGEELLAQNWSELFFSGGLYVGDALWAQYLFSFRGLSFIGSFLISLGLFSTALYTLFHSLRAKLQDSEASYELPDMEFKEK